MKSFLSQSQKKNRKPVTKSKADVTSERKEKKSKGQGLSKSGANLALKHTRELEDKSLELLVKIIPSLVRIPSKVLSDRTSLSRGLSAGSLMFGSIIKTYKLANTIEKLVQENLGIKDSIRKIFADKNKKNKALRSDAVKNLLARPEIWEALQQSKDKGKSNLLEIFANKGSYKKLDKFIGDLIKTPGTIELETKIHLFETVAENSAARKAITDILTSRQEDLKVFLTSSVVMQEQLEAQGIVKAREDLIKGVIDFIPIAVENLEKINKIRKLVAESPIQVASILKEASPLLDSKHTHKLLDEDFLKELSGELITSNPVIDKLIKDNENTLGIASEDIKKVIESFATSVVAKNARSLLNVGNFDSFAKLAEKVQVLTSKDSPNNVDKSDGRKIAALKDTIDISLELLKSNSSLISDLQDFAQENKDYLTKIINKMVKDNTGISIDGNKVVDLLANPENFELFTKALRQYKEGCGVGKIVWTALKSQELRSLALKTIANLAGNVIIKLLPGFIRRKHAQKEIDKLMEVGNKPYENQQLPELGTKQQPLKDLGLECIELVKDTKDLIAKDAYQNRCFRNFNIPALSNILCKGFDFSRAVLGNQEDGFSMKGAIIRDSKFQEVQIPGKLDMTGVMIDEKSLLSLVSSFRKDQEIVLDKVRVITNDEIKSLVEFIEMDKVKNIKNISLLKGVKIENIDDAKAETKARKLTPRGIQR